MVTTTLNNGSSTGVTDGETLSSNTAEVASTTSSTVQTGVTDNDVLLGLESSAARRVDDKTTTGQTLTDVVVGITLELQGNTRGEVSTEGLTSGTLDVGVNGVLGQTSLSIATTDLVGEGSTETTVGVDDIALNAAGETLLQSKLRLEDQLVIETSVQLVILLPDIVGSNTGAKRVSGSEDERKINTLLLGIAKVIANLEQLSTTNHLIDSTNTKFGHDGTHFVGDVVEEVNHVLWGTLKLFPKLRVLGRDTHRAGVEMTLYKKRLVSILQQKDDSKEVQKRVI
jgi:hypothetical protein